MESSRRARTYLGKHVEGARPRNSEFVFAVEDTDDLWTRLQDGPPDVIRRNISTGP